MPGDWLAEVDLKDAFFTIPIHLAHRKYLQFTFQGKVYELNCLPFSLLSAPWVFTKTLKPVIALSWELGVQLIAACSGLDIPAGMHELYNQLKKVNHKPGTDSGVPRSDSGHCVHGAETPIGQAEKDPCGVTKTRKGTDYLCPFLSTPPAEDVCNYSCHSSSSFILQTPADESYTGIGGELTILRNDCHLFPRGERGTDMVGQPHVEMEWEITSKDGDRHSDRFRCIPYKMGCNQLSTKDWRSLVGRGKQNESPQSGANQRPKWSMRSGFLLWI